MSQEKRRILTGITTSGTPHLGNYVGAIRPAIAASRRADAESFFFLADYHALVKCGDPARVQRSTLEIAASWLACGLDPDTVFFYRQSDIPEIPELTWLLTCVTAKGLLNRAHAYKAAVDRNAADGNDADAAITVGLYMYPVLMAADILAFNAHEVPVGRDQVQHIEMARDIAQRFNYTYGGAPYGMGNYGEGPFGGVKGAFFVLPEAKVEDTVATLPGTDGRKMSKSYDNTIPLWLPARDLEKAILGIVTDSRAPGEAKDADASNLFAIYRAFASSDETAAMRQAFADGIGWGDAKRALFDRVDTELAAPRERYEALIANPAAIEKQLVAGARKARERSAPLTVALRHAVGIRALSAPGVPNTQSGVIDAAASVEAKSIPTLKSYRESRDGKFYFKLTTGDGGLLMQSRAFDTPQQSGAAIAGLIEAGDDACFLPELLLACIPEEELALPTSAIAAALAQLKADKLAKENSRS